MASALPQRIGVLMRGAPNVQYWYIKIPAMACLIGGAVVVSVAVTCVAVIPKLVLYACRDRT